jgi:hypothetical protein
MKRPNKLESGLIFEGKALSLPTERVPTTASDEIRVLR